MNRDDGFTLPELLVSIVIAALIIGIAGNALITGFKTNDATSQRLSESHDAQVAASTFDRDVQSSDTVSTSDADAVCNLALGGGGYALTLSMQWTEVTPTGAPGTNYIADYLVQTRAGRQPALHRRLCNNSGGPMALQRDVILSDNLANASSAALSCVPAGCPSKPQTVSLQVTEKSGYVFVMNARRRPTP